ncbi:MAG TPA: hypothetical protein VFT80_02680, partial [Actinomycetota bacterium]|nr:hypothetical protein [Actinomycetota bacterium]
MEIDLGGLWKHREVDGMRSAVHHEVWRGRRAFRRTWLVATAFALVSVSLSTLPSYGATTL